MYVPTPQEVTETAGAATAAINALKGLFGLLRDAKDLLPPEKKQDAETAIEHSFTQIALAEAQLAAALGYQLCRCEFPPTIMLQVGVHTRHSLGPQIVYECPRCDFNTSMPYAFTRTKDHARK